MPNDPNNPGMEPGLLILPKPKESEISHGKKSKDFSGTVYEASCGWKRQGVWVSKILRGMGDR